ncbi:hypothetical protein Ahy_A06g028795 isoform G [Arachis hypogaea]|nr:hypothetical protein Ahy_A06g028795 isoform G [Arachis hypogaea]
MAMASPFSSLEHAITVARDIWSRKLNVRSWLEALSGRSCSNEYLETANEATVQELHEWGSRYEEKFGYVFVIFVAGRTSEDILAELKMHFNNLHGVELEIASKEELKYIERAIRDQSFFPRNLSKLTTKETVIVNFVFVNFENTLSIIPKFFFSNN